MSLSEHLGALLCSPDPAVRQQGAELARSLGEGTIEALAAGCVREDDGLLWRPEGLTDALLEVIWEAAAPIRGVYISGPAMALLPLLPDLEVLHLHDATLPDLSPLLALPRLMELTLHGCALGDLSGLAALSGLRRLSVLHCSALPHYQTPDRLPPLTDLTMRGVSFIGDAPLPDSLRSLDLLGGPQRFEIAALELEVLRAGATLALQLPSPASLRELEVFIGNTRHAHDLPMTRMHISPLSDETLRLADLGEQPRLSWLDLDFSSSLVRVEDAQRLSDFPALEVVSCQDGRLPALPEGMRVSPWLTHTERYAEAFGGTRYVRGSLAALEGWWQERGCRYRLQLPARDDSIPLIKLFRRQTRLGLRASMISAKLAMREEGLGCLSLSEALLLQSAMLAAGEPAVVRQMPRALR